MLGAQTADLIIDIARLHRAAARAIDAQNHALGFRVLEGGAQAANYIVRAGRLLIGNHATHLNQRRMTVTARRRLLQIQRRRKQRQRTEQIHKGQQLKKNPPTPGAALLLHTGQQGSFQQLPTLAIRSRCRLPFIRHNHSPHPLIIDLTRQPLAQLAKALNRQMRPLLTQYCQRLRPITNRH